jgi:glycosyltransferase involved in cell wall biosynthesis
MKILILSFYYPPDLGAGSFRAQSIVETLSAVKKNKKFEIQVLTTQPNRYASYKPKLGKYQKTKDNSIFRMNIPKHSSGMFDQAISFFYYALQVNKFCKKNEFDLIFATSSRLMTGFLGAYLSRVHKKKLYLDIRDIFTDSTTNIPSKKYIQIFNPIFRIIESFTFNEASRISVVSQRFIKKIKIIAPKSKIKVFTNGIDEDFLRVKTYNLPKNLKKSRFEILYAGNIGIGQGLHTILPKISKKFRTKIKITVVGDGSAKKMLIKRIKDENIKNIKILNPVNRQKLIEYYKNANALFIHLSDYDAHLRVLPSKLFEYGATGKPIIAGVKGYAKEFLKKELVGAFTFNPGNIIEFEKILKEQIKKPKTYNRKSFCKKFSRKIIINELCNDINKFAKAEDDQV